ncbi:hypothetical protein BDR03DRAFT_973975 [Suillus americanus]|nr:hypothetical protein BDR03DRAFT_973975 [Suillus americanus]
MFLRTNHAPLNKHLHHIRKSDSPYCAHCPDKEETTHHFLIECPHYQRRQASSLPFLLTNSNAVPHLVKYVNATGRMRSILGEVPLPRPSTG